MSEGDEGWRRGCIRTGAVFTEGLRAIACGCPGANERALIAGVPSGLVGKVWADRPELKQHQCQTRPTPLTAPTFPNRRFPIVT